MCSACAGPANAQVMLEYNPSSILCDYMYMYIYTCTHCMCTCLYRCMYDITTQLVCHSDITLQSKRMYGCTMRIVGQEVISILSMIVEHYFAYYTHNIISCVFLSCCV